MARLLSREKFKDAVFARDGGKCVFCKNEAVDAHHVIERKLWPDGGYYLDNGISVCGPCHECCETTVITVEEARHVAGITTIIVPPQFTEAERIDKWGNQKLPSGQRMRGELFDDPGCQAMLSKGGFLGLFTTWTKYPRTAHLPWSPGVSPGDVVNDACLSWAHDVIVTAKMDGENTTIYSDGLHARSLNTSGGPERDWIKGFHGRIAHDIPTGWRICGENLYAQHSIQYRNLRSYFLVFSVWNQDNVCLSWQDTIEVCGVLGLDLVPVLKKGWWYAREMMKFHPLTVDDDPCEGYVVRPAKQFALSEFKTLTGKYVRENHVTTDQHWKHAAIVPNGLRKKS